MSHPQCQIWLQLSAGCCWSIAGCFWQSYRDIRLSKWSCLKHLTCNTCLHSAAKEEKCDILPLPMSNNIKTSLDKLLHSEALSSQNKWFCPSCDTLPESTKETLISNCSLVLIVQLTQFSILESRAIIDEQIFDCFPNNVLKVRITLEDEVSFTNR